jgi:hypothetical protein
MRYSKPLMMRAYPYQCQRSSVSAFFPKDSNRFPLVLLIQAFLS